MKMKLFVGLDRNGLENEVNTWLGRLKAGAVIASTQTAATTTSGAGSKDQTHPVFVITIWYEEA